MFQSCLAETNLPETVGHANSQPAYPGICYSWNCRICLKPATMEMKSRMGLVSMYVMVYSRTSQTKPSPSFCNDSSVVYGATNFDAPKFVCTPRRFCAPPPKNLFWQNYWLVVIYIIVYHSYLVFAWFRTNIYCYQSCKGNEILPKNSKLIICAIRCCRSLIF